MAKKQVKHSGGDTSYSLYQSLVTPSDSTVLDPCRGIYIGVGGNVTINDQADALIVFANVPAGTVLPIQPRRIRATGTTATNIVLLH